MKSLQLLTPCRCPACGRECKTYVELKGHLSWCEKRNKVKYFLIYGKFIFIFIGSISRSSFEYLHKLIKNPIAKDDKTNTTLVLGAAIFIHNNTIKSRFFQVAELTDTVITQEPKSGMVSANYLNGILSLNDKKTINAIVSRGYEEAKKVQYKRYKSKGNVKRIMPEGSTSL
jgi:hypothetical protein